MWNVLTASTQYLHACKTRDGSESTITKECRLFVSNEHYVYMCKLYIHFMRYRFFIRLVGFHSFDPEIEWFHTMFRMMFNS